MESEINIQVRNCLPEDMGMVNAWAHARPGKFVPWEITPPDTYIASHGGLPVAFATFTLGLNVPVMWMDWLFSKPRTRASVIRSAFRAMIAEAVSRHGQAYGIIRATLIDGGLAKEAKALGFILTSETCREGMLATSQFTS